MNSVIHYTTCPLCDSISIEPILNVKDHVVSGEEFSIWQCSRCELRFTQDVPDEHSIGRYYQSENYVSHTETSKGMINQLYHFVRKRTLSEKRKLITEVTGLKNGQLLDVGSGTGAFIDEMKKNNWDVLGLEPSIEARAAAKKIYQLELKTNAHLFSLPANYFDAITLWHVLEHVHQLHLYLQQLKNVMKENGRLVIAVPNYVSLDAKIYGKWWAAYDVPRHLYHFSPKPMQLLIEKAGMKIIDIKPMWFDSFYVSLLSSKYKNGKINWIAAFWNGFRSNLEAISNKNKCSSLIYIITKNH